MSKKKKAAVVAVVLFCVVLLLASRGRRGKNVHRTVHDSFDCFTGEETKLELSNIPDGLTAEDYSYSLMLRTYPVKIPVSSDGTFVADLPDAARASAKATRGRDSYYEEFAVRIFPKNGFRFAEEEYHILGNGGSVSLTYDGYGEGVHWPTTLLAVDKDLQLRTEPEMNVVMGGLVRNQFNAFHFYIEDLKIEETTNFVLIAAFEDWEMRGPVTAYSSKDPAQVALYLSHGENAPVVSGETVLLTEPSQKQSTYDEQYDAEIMAALGTSPNGKYALCGKTDNTGTFFYASFMMLLPPELRANTISEVEYIIRVEDGEPVHYASYREEGTGRIVPGLRRTVNLVLENSSDGTEVLLRTLYGGTKFEDELRLYPGTEAIYGGNVSEEEIKSALYAEIVKLWEQEGYTVVETP